MKKLRSIGDSVNCTIISRGGGLCRLRGRIVAFIPLRNQIDVMDSRGHVWRINQD